MESRMKSGSDGAAAYPGSLALQHPHPSTSPQDPNPQEATRDNAQRLGATPDKREEGVGLTLLGLGGPRTPGLAQQL